MSPGVPVAAVEFFAELADNNTREWWKANVGRYHSQVREPFQALLGQVAPEREWRTYRPQRDTRFAKDKTPYKDFIGAVSQLDSGTGQFIRIDRYGLLVGTGYPTMARDQLTRFRAALDEPDTGDAFVTGVANAEASGVRVTGGRYPELTTAPRGYPKNHPRIEWLRVKGVEIPQRIGTPEWLSSESAADNIRDLLRRGTDVITWLDRHVGPSELTPEEIWAR